VCNSSGVFQIKYNQGCDQEIGETQNSLNPALGSCASTTFTHGGDGFFMNTCPSIAANNLILQYQYQTFPTTYPQPTCTQPNTLNLVPTAFESGTCYTLSLTTSISYTCSGGQVTENAYSSSPDCSTGIATRTINVGNCLSDSTTGPPYSDGYTFTCGQPTRAPTAAPTTAPPTVPTSEPPVGAPTQAARFVLFC
jgi:hypothetical protein